MQRWAKFRWSNPHCRTSSRPTRELSRFPAFCAAAWRQRRSGTRTQSPISRVIALITQKCTRKFRTISSIWRTRSLECRGSASTALRRFPRRSRGSSPRFRSSTAFCLRSRTRRGAYFWTIFRGRQIARSRTASRLRTSSRWRQRCMRCRRSFRRESGRR